MKNLPLSIFLPSYNEEGNIRESVLRLREAASALTDTYEIIVVNDGSKDRTASIAEAIAAEDPHVRVIHHPVNQGYGAALLSGIAAARYDWVFFTDADLQFSPKELALLVEHAPSYRVVIGYRFRRRDPFMRLVNAWGWNLLNRVLFGLRARDIDCAFKLFERKLVADLPLRSRGAMLSAEMLIRLSRSGAEWKEVPVTHLPRKRGSATGARLSVILRALKEMFRLYVTDLGDQRVLEFVKFASVGVVNTSIDLGLYFALTRLLSMGDLILAKGISYFAGTIFSFIANRFWTFSKYSTVELLEVGRFYVSVALAIMVNTGAMFVFTRLFQWNDAFSALLATVVTLGWNFLAMKFWVYSGGEEARAARPLPREVRE